LSSPPLRAVAPPPPASAVTVPLLDSLPPARSCRQEPLGLRSGLSEVAVLRGRQHAPDAIADPAEFLPIRTFDARDPRRVLADHGEASELAELLGADDLRMVDATAPRAVFDAGGDVVVQVGAAAR
jgi:hypothetical protein